MTLRKPAPSLSALGEIGDTDFQAIIFDCDGTLVDTAGAHFTSIGTALSEIGVLMERDWYDARFGLSRDDLIDALGIGGRSELVSGQLAARIGNLYEQNLHLVREIDIVSAAARRYKGVVPIAVASGGQRTIVEQTLASVGLLPLFEVIVTIEDAEKGKPAPDLFLLAARRLAIEPNRCVVFEDTNEGLDAAHAAGMRAIDVRDYRH